MNLPSDMAKKLIPLKDFIIDGFSADHWLELGAITGCLDLIRNHGRLLRSLAFQDEDYPGCALKVLITIVEQDHENLRLIEGYLNDKFDRGGTNISSSSQEHARRIYFQPSVFTVPDEGPRSDLVAAMMPFEARFSPVYDAIRQAAAQAGMACDRADNIWQESAVIQDIFGLIYRSAIVVCDFTGKNPNVFYEAGIAHTLGKHVVPITQVTDDVPFDLRHHRFLPYLNNDQGREALTEDLAKRIRVLKNRQ
tara:strand:+ start:956 stop:1708 length:753 start_codon:yes stop_codon:yes gene_type:complete